MLRLDQNINLWREADLRTLDPKGYERMQTINSARTTWRSSPDGAPATNFDTNDTRPLDKIKSHLLTDKGNIRTCKENPNGDEPPPCFAYAWANWWPDRLCTIALQNIHK